MLGSSTFLASKLPPSDALGSWLPWSRGGYLGGEVGRAVARVPAGVDEQTQDGPHEVDEFWRVRVVDVRLQLRLRNKVTLVTIETRHVNTKS